MAGVDVQAFCQANIEDNTDRAAWGLRLRADMLATCAGQDMRLCSQPYTDQIIARERADQQALQFDLRNQAAAPQTRFLKETAAQQKTSAAYMALRGVADTPEAIANEIYQNCLTQIATDLRAAQQANATGQQVAPLCSSLSDQDPGYIARCCTPDCYCDVYCQ